MRSCTLRGSNTSPDRASDRDSQHSGMSQNGGLVFVGRMAEA
jgi:hypothetical protein